MSLESADFIPGLVETNPEGTDPKSQGDDHLRLLKHVLKSQFPNFTGEAVTKTEAQINAQLDQGDFGLGTIPGGPRAEVVDANAITATGFYNLIPPYTNGPTAASYSIIHITYDNSPVQLAFMAATNNATVYVRSWGSSWGPWERIWTDESLVKQEYSYDITAGRMLAVGAFGLGSSVAWQTLDANTVTVTRYDPLAPGAPNAPISAYGMLHSMIGPDINYGSQTFHQLTAAALPYGEYWHRFKTAGVWNQWVKGAHIQEEALIANGYRITGGLVEQWGQTAAIGDDQTITVTFPHAMAETFNVIAQPIASVPNVTFIVAGVHSVTGNGFNLTNMNNSGAVCPFYWQARGRI